MGEYVTDLGEEIKETKESKRELKKHAATIHCSNTLSLLQRKITNALLYHAYKELALKDEHEITVKQLCRLIGYQGNNHAAIREAFRGLISTVIEWNLIDDKTGNENWTASSIIASVSLEGPLCYYAYSPRMKQLLHSPSMFGKIDLVIQSKFRSSYGLALYENCIRYRGLPHTKWFEMPLFKKLMGVPQGKYEVFRDFKKRVLDKSVDEVNMYSDLVIAPEYVREGRKVVRVRFKLKERAKKTRLGGKSIGESDFKNNLATLFALSTEQIEQVLTDSKAFKEGRIENLSAYLLSALKHDYQAPKLRLITTTQKKKDQTFELNELKRQIENIRHDYNVYREVIIEDAIHNLKTRKKKKFMTGFFAMAEPVINTILQLQRNKYSRETVLESPQIRALLRQYALRELDLLNLASLEEYVAQLDENKRTVWQKFKSQDPDHPLLCFTE
jgi:hypothetical protein